MISLKKLLAETIPDGSMVFPPSDVLIKGLECDSKKIQEGFLFFAIRGTKIDGAGFVREAIDRGAAGVVADRCVDLPKAMPLILVSDCRLAMARLASGFYGNPSARMQMVGITGTNGKTTSSYLIEHLLLKQNKKVGVLGTVNYRFGDKKIPAVETTPGPLRIQEILAEMADESCEVAVMEVSSHALDQHRTGGIDFKTALFTNLTQDHLDYHGSMKNYFECKSRLFTALSGGSFSILNHDDEWARKLEKKGSSRVITYGIESGADLSACGIKWKEGFIFFEVTFQKKKIAVHLPLIGRHNVYNALGSLAVLGSLGFDVEKCAGDLADFKGVPGRLEAVRAGQDFLVFVDFAHTPDGLLNVLESLKPYQKNKLIVVFGCGGDRDKGKRPQMGRIAGQHADQMIITSDNPRSEDPKMIAQEIREGLPLGFKNYSIVLDRKKAIRQALLSAKKGDIVLLAGKGHETTQIIGEETFPFNDKEEAERVLNGH